MSFIRISKHIYIDNTVILIGFLAFCIGKLPHLLILYCSVFLHEIAHLVACILLGEKAEGIRFMPYGMNLRIGNVENPADAMIIALSGPLASLVIWWLSGMFGGEWVCFFRLSNMAVFLLNIFPALPLDGGVFVKNALAYRLGYVRAHRISLGLTRMTTAVFAIFGIIFFIISKYNISLLVISGILMYNLNRERKQLIFLKRMIYTKSFAHNSKTVKIQHRGVIMGVSAISLTDYFGYNFICHFFVYDKDMKLLGTLEQSEIIDGIIAHGPHVTVGDLIGGTNEHQG